MIYFVTGNKGKFEEAKAILDGELEQLDINLPELQEIDAHKIIQAKLKAAFDHHDGQFIVDDTSLYLDCLNGLPGPLIKWFLQTVGKEGLYKITQAFGDNKARAKAIIGYATGPDDIQFFEGVVSGMIVDPKGIEGFGWDSIFLPDGQDKTYAEMTADEKNAISHRQLALDQQRDF
jgi:non-canonical purine NTP pyrophosphatase (RdgB/HAM1 family)